MRTSLPLVRVFEEKDFVTMGLPQPGVDHDPRDEGYGRICKLISGELTGSADLHLAVVRINPGGYHIKHYHPNGSQWYYFVRGSCLVHVDGANVRATAGTIVYLPPGAVHAIKNDSDEEAELLAGNSLPDYRDMGRVYVEPDGDEAPDWTISEEHRFVARVSEEDFVPFTASDPGGPGAVIDARDKGSIVKLVSRRLMGAEDVHVSVARIHPGDYHLKHHHPNGTQVYYILSGECTAYIDGTESLVSRGTAIYLPPNTVHSLNNEGAETLELVTFLNRPEYAEIGLVYDE